MKLSSLLLIFCLMFGIGAHAASPRLHNYADDFSRFWNSVQSLPLDKQIEAFDQVIYPEFPDFYDYKFERWRASGISKEDGLKKEFDEFRTLQKAFDAKSASIGTEINANLQTFLQSFPDMDTDFDIYVIHSLGEMDGGTRTLNGKFYFIFGIDGILRYHNAKTDVPFFHHELFHVYHSKYFNATQMWSAMWFEGFATYVSQALNPGSSLRDIMLEVPEGMPETCEKDLSYLWNDVRSNFDSQDDEVYRHYFLLSSKDPRIPRRAGYYLGYLIAKDLAQTHSLVELAKMPPEQARGLISDAVDAHLRAATGRTK